jgi:dihydrofolate reductase
MKIICVMVQSANGKITNGNDPTVYKWTSKEDKAQFEALIAKHSCIIMGRETYEAAKKVIKPVPGKLRIVLTRSPEDFAEFAVPGQLEFRTATPQELAAELEPTYQEVLLCGGGQINSLFLNAGLIHEFILTIEPELFGQGKGIITEDANRASLRLISIQQLNERGTILAHYAVLPAVSA